uniref:Ionotropic glutamate receptor C-terminal domain-containing protein n=1 Tax=Anopheles christyi TaxID=43041 RepID=A0A182JYF5_9DIPT
MVLYPGIAPELRNDFFGQANITIMVYASAARHINSTYVAQSIPLFRNARVRTYRIANGGNRVDLHFQLITTNDLNTRLQGWYSYSLPLFHEHLTMYIHYAKLSYHERSTKILMFILIPFGMLGLLLCVSLLLALRTGSSRRANPGPAVSFVDALIWIVGVFAQQGSIVRPTSTSSMIIILVALYMSSIIYCTYLTKIASQLSVDVSVDLDLQTLLLAGQYQIGFVGNFTSDQTIVRKRYDPLMNSIMERMTQDTSLYALSYEHGLHRVLTSKYALIGNVGSVRMALQNLDENQNCNITEIELRGIEQMVALQMPSFYAYRKMINYE